MTDPEPRQTAFTRRKYLKWTATIGLVGTAGCSGGGSTTRPAVQETEPPNESPTPSPTTTPTATASPTPSAKSQLKEGQVYRETPSVDLKLHGIVPDADEPVPSIIWAHGGGWTPPRQRKQVNRHMEWLADKGYGGVSAEYRLSTEATYPAAVRDLAAAVLWVRDRAPDLGIDGNRLGLAGYSAGAHMATLLAAAPDNDRFRPKDAANGADYSVSVGASFSSPFDLTHPTVRAVDEVQQYMGTTYEEDQERYREASPITHVDGDEPPSMLFQSVGDHLFPIDQANAYRFALKEAGVPVSIFAPTEFGHGFFERGDFLETIMSQLHHFLNSNL